MPHQSDCISMQGVPYLIDSCLRHAKRILSWCHDTVSIIKCLRSAALWLEVVHCRHCLPPHPGALSCDPGWPPCSHSCQKPGQSPSQFQLTHLQMQPLTVYARAGSQTKSEAHTSNGRADSLQCIRLFVITSHVRLVAELFLMLRP